MMFTDKEYEENEAKINAYCRRLERAISEKDIDFLKAVENPDNIRWEMISSKMEDRMEELFSQIGNLLEDETNLN